MSTEFVEELADKVSPEHLSEADEEDRSPMRLALRNTTSAVEILKYLILRGVDLRARDFASGYRQQRRKVLDWVRSELQLHRMFVALVLGCGVHDIREQQLIEEGRMSDETNENQVGADTIP